MNVIAPIILILGSIGIFFGYINPNYAGVTGSTDIGSKSVTELQTDEKDYTDALTKTRQIELVREGLLTKFNALKPSDKDKILKFLPDHIDSVRLIIDINNIASKYGMSLSGIVLSTPTTGSKTNPVNQPIGAGEASVNVNSLPQGIGPDSSLYGSVTLGFSVTGPYENFLQFLNDLQKSLRVVDVTALSFKASKVSPSVAKGQAIIEMYDYSMTIRTYYLK